MIPNESPMTLAGYMPTRDEYDRAIRLVRALTAQLAAKDAEVARLTAALESARGAVANNERHIDIVTEINAALRGDTAPAQPSPIEWKRMTTGEWPAPAQHTDLCGRCGHSKNNHAPMLGCVDCECPKYEPAPAGGESA